MQLFQKLAKNKIFILCVALFIVLFPKVRSRPSESDLRAIVNMVGVDLTENNEFEISVNIIMPKTSSDVNANLFTLSQKGKTINHAFLNLSYNVGRFVGLAHCEAIVIGKKVFENDVTQYIDYFVRTNNLTTNSLIFVAENSAKEILELTTKSENPQSQSIKNIIKYNEELYLPVKMNIENFYKAYHSPQGVALIGEIGVKSLGGGEQGQQGSSGGGGGNAETTSSGDQNISSSNANSSNSEESSFKGGGGGGGEGGSSSGGGSGGGSQSGKQKVLENKSNFAIVKKGKHIRTCTEDERKIINLIHKGLRRNLIVVDDIDVLSMKDATVTFEVIEKKNKIKYFFNNGIPTVLFDLKLYCKIDEINSPIITINSADEISNYMYDEVKEKIIHKVKKDFAKLNNYCIENKIDLFAVFDNFYKFHTKQWNKYIESLDDQNDYLNGVVFQMKIHIINTL